jgi:class 3 adenylate cyclase
MPDPNGPRYAVACARDFQDACGKINERLSEAGLPSITYGIGLHTGEVVAAHVGTEVRRVYTVLGDTVNVGSRLCTIAGRNEIVVSEETYRRLEPQPPAEVLPGIRLKGVGRELLPHRLWPEELRDPTGEVRGKVEA